VFTDALFVNNKDLFLQIGYILVLVDIINKANIMYWSSIKYKRITKSVLIFKLYTIVHRFNIGAIIKLTVK
jgi:hypothetical protein